MSDRTPKRGYWLIRIGLGLTVLVGLSLAGLGLFLSDRLGGAMRVLGPRDLSRLTRENALQILAMDESLLESNKGVLNSVVNVIFFAAALLLVAAVLGGIGIFRSRRRGSGADRGLPSSGGTPETTPSDVPNSG